MSTLPAPIRSRAAPATPPHVELEVIGTTTNITALPVQVNLSLYAGDDFAMVVNVKNPDSTNMDLTGYTATAQIKARTSDTTALATFTCTPGGTASATLPASSVYDCQMKSAGGLITTLIAGVVTITAQVTTP